MDSAEALVRVQSAYPRIYLACHSRHQNARTTPEKLSQRDASLLAHLDERRAVSNGELARHMGMAKSTSSEALSGLEACGYVARRDDGTVVRTPAGTQAMSNASVLETAPLLELLEVLTPEERLRAVEGLELIAYAAEKRNRSV